MTAAMLAVTPLAERHVDTCHRDLSQTAAGGSRYRYRNASYLIYQLSCSRTSWGRVLLTPQIGPIWSCVREATHASSRCEVNLPTTTRTAALKLLKNALLQRTNAHPGRVLVSGVSPPQVPGPKIRGRAFPAYAAAVVSMSIVFEFEPGGFRTTRIVSASRSIDLRARCGLGSDIWSMCRFISMHSPGARSR